MLMTIDEVAAVLRVPRARVYELIRLGLLPSVHLGRQVRVDEAALSEWVRAGGSALPKVPGEKAGATGQ